MNRLSITMSNVWLRIRRTRAKILTRIYAQYKRKSSPVRMGERTIYFETYCPSIQNTCDDLGVAVPILSPRIPNRIEEWFLSWRFGWPWPIRLASYGKKTLEVIATTPDEMAAVTQHIWDISCTQDIHQKDKPGKTLLKPSRQQAITSGKQEQVATILQKRLVNPPQMSSTALVRPVSVSSSTPKPIKPIQEVIATVEGAIMDNSF